MYVLTKSRNQSFPSDFWSRDFSSAMFALTSVLYVKRLRREIKHYYDRMCNYKPQGAIFVSSNFLWTNNADPSSPQTLPPKSSVKRKTIWGIKHRNFHCRKSIDGRERRRDVVTSAKFEYLSVGHVARIPIFKYTMLCAASYILNSYDLWFFKYSYILFLIYDLWSDKYN